MKRVIGKYLNIIGKKSYILFNNLIDKVFFFLFFLILARLFPVSQYGDIVVVFTIGNVLITLTSFGIPVLLQKETASRSGKEKKMLFDSVILYTVAGLVYIIASYLVYFIFYASISFLNYTLIIISVYLFSFLNLFNYTLYGASKFKEQFFAVLYSRMLTLLFISLLSFVYADITALLIIFFLGNIFYVFKLIKTAKENNLLEKNKICFKDSLNLIKLSLPLGISVIFNFLYDKIDVLVISRILDNIQVAYYSAGYGVYKSATLVFGFILIGGFSRVSYLSRRKTAVKIFFRKYFILISVICLITALIIYFFSESIIVTLFSEKYIKSAEILKILSFSVIPIGLNNLAGIMLNALSLFKINMNVQIVASILNFALNILLIPVFGIVTAAYITILTEFFIFAADSIFVLRHIKNMPAV